jgi:hypothetical protein
MGEILEIKRGEAGLFGYGSLLLQRSMEQTLGRPYTRKRYACKLHDWCRCWNALYPSNRYYFSTGGDERLYPASIAYLNIGRADVSVNGVLTMHLRSTEADENDSSGRARRPVQHWNLFRGSVWPRGCVEESIIGHEALPSRGT